MFGRQPLSYANVVASLALFVALGGTAAAAVTLDRDSVGSREIREGAVRSAELLDGGVRIADISPGARHALLGDVRFVETGRLVDFLDTCAGNDVTECPNQLELDLEADSGSPTGEDLREDAEPGRDWLVQAKLEVGGTKGESSTTNRCGLVEVRSPARVAARRGAVRRRGRGADRAERRGEEARRRPDRRDPLHRAAGHRRRARIGGRPAHDLREDDGSRGQSRGRSE